MPNSEHFAFINVNQFLDSVNLSQFLDSVSLEDTMNYVKLRASFLVPCMTLFLMVILTIVEIKTKLETRALRILLTADKRSGRKVMVINFAQIVLQLSIMYFNQITSELQAVACYNLTAKLMLMDRKQLNGDLAGIASTAIFVFLSKTQSTFSILEMFDGLVTEVLFLIVPTLLSALMLIILPLIIPSVIATLMFFTVYSLLWLVVMVRRKYPEDFDFFVTLAICVLVWKILKKELVQRQVKSLICSKLESRQLLDSGLTGTQAVYDPGLERVVRWCEASHHHSFQHPLHRMDNDAGYFGALSDLRKPDNMSYLDFYLDLNSNYRMMNILRTAETPDGCRLTVSHAPSDRGLKGILKSSLYRIYILASWILPEAYQGYLSVFGFQKSSMTVNCDCNCTNLTKQIILQKIN